MRGTEHAPLPRRMILVAILFLLGLVGLVVGGDFLVKGSVGLAQRIGISPLIIGLTIVAFGTSAPELVISLDAALGGSGGLAVGNVVGSNIANVLLVLGLPALILPMTCDQDGVQRIIYFLLGVTLLFIWQMSDGTISRLDGVVLLVALTVFLGSQAWRARQERMEALEADLADEVGEVPTETWRIAAYMVGGLVLLPLGARLTVNSAIDIAEVLNISKEVVGLTIVAIGTSLPELATGVMAARSGESSVGIGNIVGSNFFNIAAIAGITSSVVPLPVDGHIMTFDVWVMLGATVLLAALALTQYCVGRWSGLALMSGFVAYLAVTASF